MKSFAAAALVASVTAIDNATFDFMKYVSEHGKSYTTVEEFNMRQALFAERNEFIQAFNADTNNTSRVGHNFLSDWTAEELKNLRGLDTTHVNDEEPTHFATQEVSAVSTYNWCSTENDMSKDKCTPVKNQGQCGSCWAFSATETVESAIAIFNDATPVQYSPQQLVSCSSAYGNGGCNGGWYYYAWNYLKTHAQVSEADYPYTSGKFGITGTCTVNESQGLVNTDSPTDYVRVGHTNADMMTAIKRQPTSVAIDASSSTFNYYTTGVITSGCGTSIDHAVVAVGYGTENGTDYFLVRNSWGSSWGDNGFVKIAQSSTNGQPGYCGINTDPYYPNARYA